MTPTLAELEAAAKAYGDAAYECGDHRKDDGPFGPVAERADIAFAALLDLASRAVAPKVDSYQSRVQPWLDACFGRAVARDKVERNHRFIEEALELVQSTGCTQSEAHQLVDYVYGREIGDPKQEVGGVMNTLAALCLAHGLDMHECGEIELARVWTKVEKIRAKQAAKPKHSPLPEAPASQSTVADAGDEALVDQLISLADHYHESGDHTAVVSGRAADLRRLAEQSATIADLRAEIARLKGGAK